MQKKNPEPDKATIKATLQLPQDSEGDEKLEKMLSCFDDSFSQREKLFILFSHRHNLHHICFFSQSFQTSFLSDGRLRKCQHV